MYSKVAIENSVFLQSIDPSKWWFSYVFFICFFICLPEGTWFISPIAMGKIGDKSIVHGIILHLQLGGTTLYHPVSCPSISKSIDPLSPCHQVLVASD